MPLTVFDCKGIPASRREGIEGAVAAAVAFLAGDAAAFITGLTIWVDGGLFSKPQWPREYE